MPTSLRPARGSPSPVPLFPLYGEARSLPSPELLHCETIAARSRLHGWVIEPHRHSDLAQVLWISHGTATFQIDGRHGRASGPVLLYLPPLCVHGFGFDPDVQGHVLTLGAPLLERLGRELDAAHRLHDPVQLHVRGQATAIAGLCSQLAEEHAGDRPAREPLMRAMCLQLLVHIVRGGTEAAMPGARAQLEQRMARFRELVEQHYAQHLPVGHYAQRLGVSEASLNRTCRELAGTTAKGLLHQRLLLEASRHLAYTDTPVQRIADLLGFSDPAYFSRFFSRAMGCSPRDYRGTAPASRRRG